MLERFFPFIAAPKGKDITTTPDGIAVTKLLNSKVLGIEFNGAFSSYPFGGTTRANFEESPYDFRKIIEAIDTDSYIKQGFAKYKELFWKEGWDIVSENQDAVNYLWQRIDLFEEVMGIPFVEFLMQVVDELTKFGNVFIIEVRKDIRPIFPGKLFPLDNKETICGYQILPTETIKILRDKFNNPISYRQSLIRDNFFGAEKEAPTWDADEVIHLTWDKKPGRIFGTPFVINALDDVISLRRIEEDVLNVVHQEVYPLYSYTIGTEERPSTPEEVEQAVEQIEYMRTSGALVMPERHKVDVISSSGSSMDAMQYLNHFTQRVASGMGLSPHHLGMMMHGGNRSVTDRLDIALYDRIKLFQAAIENHLRLQLFNPLLREGGFDPLIPPSAKGDSDRCFMKFREIDIDTQVKKQNHIVNMFVNNVIDLEEARMALGKDGHYDMAHMYLTLAAHVQAIGQIAVTQAAAAVAPVTTKTPAGAVKTGPPAGLPKPVKPDAQNPSSGILPNLPNKTKGPGNISRPSNQFGRRNSPNIRHMDEDVLNDILGLLEKDDYNDD